MLDRVLCGGRGGAFLNTVMEFFLCFVARAS